MKQAKNYDLSNKEGTPACNISFNFFKVNAISLWIRNYGKNEYLNNNWQTTRKSGFSWLSFKLISFRLVSYSGLSKPMSEIVNLISKFWLKRGICSSEI